MTGRKTKIQKSIVEALNEVQEVAEQRKPGFFFTKWFFYKNNRAVANLINPINWRVYEVSLVKKSFFFSLIITDDTDCC